MCFDEEKDRKMREIFQDEEAHSKFRSNVVELPVYLKKSMTLTIDDLAYFVDRVWRERMR